MPLKQLSVQGFRNIKQLSLDLSENYNLIVGDNGSGKTSILEAIYFLSHGRSFRTSSFNKVINYTDQQFTVHVRQIVGCSAEDDKREERLGLSKTQDGQTAIRIDGASESRLSELAKHLAVQLITPDSVSFFLGGPKERRQFCDLGLFHVKQSYQDLWSRFNRVLKQRNALLKQNNSNAARQVQYWDQEFVRLSLEIDTLRREYVVQLQQHLDNLQQEFCIFTSQVKISYSQGWKKDTELEEELTRFLERDFRLGNTSVGPHKADIKFRVDANYPEELKVNVADTFSRGQIKLLLYAVKVCQNQIICEHGKKPVLLVDDISSEIDEDNLVKILQLLDASHSQLVITAISDEKLGLMEQILKDIKLFHVKHGTMQ